MCAALFGGLCRDCVKTYDVAPHGDIHTCVLASGRCRSSALSHANIRTSGTVPVPLTVLYLTAIACVFGVRIPHSRPHLHTTAHIISCCTNPKCCGTPTAHDCGNCRRGGGGGHGAHAGAQHTHVDAVVLLLQRGCACT